MPTASTRRFAILAIATAIAMPPARASQSSPISTPVECAPQGSVRFICGARKADDLVRIPGAHWVVASSLDGGVSVINTRDRTLTALYPSSNVKERLDKAMYAACPGPPSAEEQAKFVTAGIALQREKNGNYALYAVHFGWERAVDVFDLDARGKTPSVTWVGCVLAPEPIGLAAVAPLRDGGFIGTNWLARGEAGRTTFDRMKAGANNGEVWEWHSDKGWSKVPGSDSSGNDGAEISKDGKWLYVDAWGGQYFYRLSRGIDPPQRDSIPLGFHAGRIRWSPDGLLFIAGQTEDGKGSKVVKIDPKSLKVTPIIDWSDTPTFGSSAVAIQIGSEIWLGSARSDRIAIFPAPK
jgi:hypothetical protein